MTEIVRETIRDENDKPILRDEVIVRLNRKAFESIMNELGVPGETYPAPVTNAYEIAKEALEVSN